MSPFGKIPLFGKSDKTESNPKTPRPPAPGTQRNPPPAPPLGAQASADSDPSPKFSAPAGASTAQSGASGGPAGPNLKVVLPVIIVLGSIFLSVMMAVLKPKPAIEDDAAKRAMLVRVMPVRQENVQIKITSQGRVQPITKTLMISEVGGAVIEVSPQFVTGGFVSKGQVLLRLDDRNYRASVGKGNANLAAMEKFLIEERGRSRVQENEFKRSGQKQRSPEAMELYLRKPHLREAEANYESAKADLARVRGDLEKTVVRAPYDGLIKKRSVDLAQYVTPGTPLAEIVSIDVAEVRLAIPQDRLAYMALPMPAAENPSTPAMPATTVDPAAGSVATQAVPPTLTDIMQSATSPLQDARGVRGEDAMKFPNVTLTSRYGNDEYQWQGKLVRTEGMFDENSHVLHVIAHVEDPYRVLQRNSGDQFDTHVPLLLGSYVKAEIEGRLFEGITVIPRHVLRAGNQVWVVDENLQLRNRQVEILNTGGDFLYVTSGLQDGEQLCLTNIGEVVPGTKVRLQTETGTAGVETGAVEQQ